MTWLIATGLLLDALGVFLLGADLIRIQGRVRSTAAESEVRLQELIDRHNDLESKLEETTLDMGWQMFNLEEGRPTPDYDSYDPELLVRLSGSVRTAVARIREYVGGISILLIEAQEAERRTAETSLRYSYVGLPIIFIGFVLQIIGTIGAP